MRIIRITMVVPADSTETLTTPPGVAQAAVHGGAIRRCTSRDLLGSTDRLLIEHGGETYVLRLTRQGKLILTK
jgi:hemin uptake protein HemP